MMTQYMLSQGADSADRMGLDDIIRMTPTYGDGHREREVYRCPVSTPANARSRGKNHTFVSFTNLNRRSLQIPNHVSNPRSKHQQTTGGKMKSSRMETTPRKKNFEYYFTERPHVRVRYSEGPQSVTWLKSLCSQPVDEIFTKYKRRSESESGVRCVSTPGEKALAQGWSSNVSHRSYSSLSRSTRSGMSVATDSRLSMHTTPSAKLESSRSPSFALMPVSQTGKPKTEVTPSIYRQKAVLKTRPKPNSYSSPPEMSTVVVDDLFYDKFKRDAKKSDEKYFPELNNRRNAEMVGKQRKYFTESEAAQELILKHDDLEESMIQIVPFGKFFDGKREDELESRCSYCLPDSIRMNDKLPAVKTANE